MPKFLVRFIAHIADCVMGVRCNVPRTHSCSTTSGTPRRTAKGQPTMPAMA